MKKTRQYSLLAIVLAVSLLSSCTQDDDSSRSSVSPALEKGIVVSVSDGLYGSQGGTRAIPNGMETVFEQGDAIGVFAVDAEGKVVCSNVKYVCNGVNWNLDNATTVPVQFDAGNSYYAYFPYQADLSELASGIAEGETVAASTADAFFEELTSNWEVKDNQKTKADYLASDLMVAKGIPNATVGDFAIDFNMLHQMGLVLLSFGEMTREVDASITWTEPVTKSFKGEAQPYDWNGICRYIVKPNVEKELTASDDTWTKKVKVSTKGCFREYKINGSMGYNLAVGDIAWSDGSFSKTMQYDRYYDKRPIGIVAHLGSDDITGTYTDDEGKLRLTHGIVVGTAPVYGTMFTTNDQSIADKSSAFVNCNSYELAAKDFGGLKKTDFLHSLGDGFLAAKVRAYGRKAPLTYKNSGWYVGSAGQWCQMMSDLTGNTAFLNNWKANDKEPNWNNRGVDANIKGTLIGEYRLGKVTSDYYSWGNSQLITTSSVGTGGNFIAFAFAGNGNTYAYLTTIANTTNGWTFPIYSF